MAIIKKKYQVHVLLIEVHENEKGEAEDNDILFEDEVRRGKDEYCSYEEALRFYLSIKKRRRA